MKNGKTFKREEIKQHKEVLPNGLFIPKTISKTKRSQLNKILEIELKKEVNEYLSGSDCEE